MNGMPIYLDKVARPLCDPADQGSAHDSWHPGNVASQRLFRCVECLRDINDALADAGAARNEVKQRRKLKQMFIPLLSLAESITDLIHILQSNEDALSRMQPTDPKLLQQIKTKYQEFVPLSSAALLRQIRNKMAAHVDKDLWPNEAQALLAQAKHGEIGLWIHTSLTVLSDLLKLKVYAWVAASKDARLYRLMHTEPFLVTFRIENGAIVELVGADMVSQSPRTLVMLLIEEIIQHSQWMFQDGEPRIQGLVQDQPGDHWAKSLRTLPSKKSP